MFHAEVSLGAQAEPGLIHNFEVVILAKVQTKNQAIKDYEIK